MLCTSALVFRGRLKLYYTDKSWIICILLRHFGMDSARFDLIGGDSRGRSDNALFLPHRDISRVAAANENETAELQGKGQSKKEHSTKEQT